LISAQGPASATRHDSQLVRHHARIKVAEDLSAVEPVVLLRRDAVEPGA
jgi:hypothetical protein